MARIKTSIASKRRKKRLLKLAKGQFAQRRNRYRQAVKSVVRGMRYAFRDRKARKQEFRKLWIVRVNAGCREAGITYSQFIKGLTAAKVDINRKILAELAANSPAAFKKLVKVAQDAGSAKPKKKTKS